MEIFFKNLFRDWGVKMKNLQRYLSIYWSFFKTSLIADLEYRFNFAVSVFNDVLWYGAQIITFEVLFLHSSRLGDWTLDQVRVFLGVLFIVDAVYMLFVHDNLNSFSEKVSRGDLDFLLLKPINSQFLVSCQKFVTPALLNILISSSWLGWALSQLEGWTWWNLALFLLIIPNAVLVVYTMRFVFSAISVILTRSENIQFLWFAFYRIGTRPDTIYNPAFRLLIITIIPVGLVASVPSRVLFGDYTWQLVFWCLAIGPLFLWLSTRFWKFCLSRYASASS